MATDTPLAESIRIDEFCHANGIAFIKVGQLGAGPGMAGSRPLLRGWLEGGLVEGSGRCGGPVRLALFSHLQPCKLLCWQVGLASSTLCWQPHAHSLAALPPQADVRGVFAQVFCDFGPSFEVLDVDGEAS